MLARKQGRARYLKLLVGTGEVQYDVHFRVVKRIVHRVVYVRNIVFFLSILGTRVRPLQISTEPAAISVNPGCMLTLLSASLIRPSCRIIWPPYCFVW